MNLYHQAQVYMNSLSSSQPCLATAAPLKGHALHEAVSTEEGQTGSSSRVLLGFCICSHFNSHKSLGSLLFSLWWESIWEDTPDGSHQAI